ncbi:MAG: hypothetical protein KDE46_16985, partial [Caldilineaceae bacterium]|nr:hypothetical protein [Caldilineaceae bacterium]
MFTRILYPLLCIVLLVGCGAEPAATAEQAAAPAPTVAAVAIDPGSCGLALDANAAPTEAIAATLNAEGEMVVQQNIDALMALWDADGQIIDA